MVLSVHLAGAYINQQVQAVIQVQAPASTKVRASKGATSAALAYQPNTCPEGPTPAAPAEAFDVNNLGKARMSNPPPKYLGTRGAIG